MMGFAALYPSYDFCGKGENGDHIYSVIARSLFRKRSEAGSDEANPEKPSSESKPL